MPDPYASFLLTMAFADLPNPLPSVDLLQRSLQQNRLGHAYLFTGNAPDILETLACSLAKTLNCTTPPSPPSTGPRSDSCDTCPSCRRIDAFLHPDVIWIRPESKLRVITIGQIRDVMHAVNLKPTEARWKVTVIVNADRLNVQAANAFLKTLEEPPPRSILLLLSTEPQRLLETVLSRCLRLNFTTSNAHPVHPNDRPWLSRFVATAAQPQSSLISRYQLLGQFLSRLVEIRKSVETTVSRKSPLQSYRDVDPDLRDKWEHELNAAIEAEYRRQRTDLLNALHWWLRDVWIITQVHEPQFLCLPDLQPHTSALANRLSSNHAFGNLQTWERTRRILDSNVQEALAVEVGMLKLHL